MHMHIIYVQKNKYSTILDIFKRLYNNDAIGEMIKASLSSKYFRTSLPVAFPIFIGSHPVITARVLVVFIFEPPSNNVTIIHHLVITQQ